MKPVAVLDLSIFAIPNSIETIEGLNSIFTVLENWSDNIGKQNCINIVVSDNAIDDLEEANCFPAIHNIQALLEMHGLDHVFSAKDINKRIFKILSRAGALGDVLGVKIDSCKVECTAAEALRDVSEVLLASAHKVACAVGVYIHHEPDAQHIVALVPGFNVNGASMEVVATDIEGARDPNMAGVFGNIGVHVNVVTTPTSFLRSVSADAAWKMAENGQELALPIALRSAQKLEAGLEQLPLQVGRNFSVGEHFYGSLEEVEAVGSHKHAATTLDRCATVVADNTLIFERDFKQKRKTDAAGARRVHLTKGKLGLRLMFWEQASGRIEFANVGVKHAEEIFEGNPGQAFEATY